jgi:ABC-type Fe3+ transport system permease subunit
MLTVVSVFLWVVLPVAIYYQRRVRREVAESAGRYRPPHWLVDRPILLVVAVWFVFFTVVMAAMLVLTAFGVSPV